MRSRLSSDRSAGSCGSPCRAGIWKRNQRAEDHMRGWQAWRILLLVGLAAALLAKPAAAQNRTQETTRITAVATFSILVDLVKQVGPDGDAHVYSPTPGDAKKLAAAKVVFVNGLGLEGWMTRLVKASGTRSPIVTVTNGITARKMEDEGEPGRLVIDPHAWQSVANAKI